MAELAAVLVTNRAGGTHKTPNLLKLPEGFCEADSYPAESAGRYALTSLQPCLEFFLIAPLSRSQRSALSVPVRSWPCLRPRSPRCCPDANTVSQLLAHRLPSPCRSALASPGNIPAAIRIRTVLRSWPTSPHSFQTVRPASLKKNPWPSATRLA